MQEILTSNMKRQSSYIQCDTRNKYDNPNIVKQLQLVSNKVRSNLDVCVIKYEISFDSL